MIVGTSYSPAKAFVAFATEFIRNVASSDFGKATSGLDAADDGHRWTKRELVAALQRVTPDGISPPDGLARSAEPQLEEKTPGEVFEVSHRLPSNGKWTDAVVTFRFERQRGEYFRVLLVGVGVGTSPRQFQ